MGVVLEEGGVFPLIFKLDFFDLGTILEYKLLGSCDGRKLHISIHRKTMSQILIRVYKVWPSSKPIQRKLLLFRILLKQLSHTAKRIFIRIITHLSMKGPLLV